MSDNIPYDIQTEIIKSLPVKSLIRFRSVSKQWYSFIGSSKFINEYHTHKKHRHHLLVRYCTSYDYSDDKYVSIIDDDTFPQHKFSIPVPPSVELIADVLRPHISSQGLLFVHLDHEFCSGTLEARIWNPFIRKSVDIDVCCEPRPDILTFGFGVCPDTCDPKIVKFRYYQNWGTFFEVFTLSTNAWRKLTKNLPGECTIFPDHGVATDRFMYWLACEVDVYDPRNLIVLFDMTSEEFTEINLPHRLKDCNLYNIRESLVMVQRNEKQVYSVWKMMEHGVSKSFTKLYNINTTYVIYHVYGFRKSGEPIVKMINDPENDLSVYEPCSKHISYIGIPGSTRYFDPTVYSYVETLLLLDH